MSLNSSISIKDGKIIFVSDLEGCAEFSTTSQFGPYKSSPQSQVLCSSEFFDKLDNFLSEKEGNKVAFLGDYFDKGPMALESITLIVDLYEKYNKINKKVYIILGNRDLNKLRLPYELQEEIIKSCSNNNQNILRWTAWKSFYEKILNPENVTSNRVTRQNAIIDNNVTIPAEFKKKLELILELSMGALDNPNIDALTKDNYSVKTTSKKNNILKKTVRNLHGILVFNMKNNGNYTVGFCDPVIKLFEYGTIVEYDETYKVLISHAGGMDETIFNKIKKTEDLLIVFSESTSEMDYFSRIEWFRLELIKPLSTIYYNNNNNNKLSIQELCNSINYLLDEVKINTSGFTNFSQKLSNSNSNSNSNSKKTICPEYYLLQAMGLKGDGGHFASFVESCDTPGGCGGPKDSTASYSAFLKELKKMGVDIISCGHIPQCTPVPLIYKRQSFKSANYNSKLDPIVIILNDTSNGYRPNNINDASKVPLSFIEKMGNTTHVGVGLLNNSRMIECNLENHLSEKNISTMKPSNKKFACQLEGNNLKKFIDGTKIEEQHSKEWRPSRLFRSVSGRDRRYSRQNFVDSGAQPLLLLRNLKQKSNENGSTAKFDKIVDETKSLKEYKILLRTWNIKSKNFPYFINHSINGRVSEKNSHGKNKKNANGKLKMIDGCVPYKAIKYTDSTYLHFIGGFKSPEIVDNIPPECTLSKPFIPEIGNKQYILKNGNNYIFLGKYLGPFSEGHGYDLISGHRFNKKNLYHGITNVEEFNKNIHRDIENL